MTDASKQSGKLGAKARADLEARLQREAAALRANLKRRKQQVHARKEKAPQDEENGDDP